MSFQHVSDKPRNERDHYPTIDEDLTRAILPRLVRHKYVWEPCCGTGEMARVLKEAVPKIYCSDIHDYGYEGQHEVCDFLTKEQVPEGVTAIVTNPPFGRLAEPVIRHAINLMQPVGGSVLMLLRTTWDNARTRRDLYQWPHIAKHIMLWRPYWSLERTSSPQHNYAWFEWDWSSHYVSAPRTLHIDKSDIAK